MVNLATNHVGNDLHIVVGMRAETPTGGDAVVVQYPEHTEMHPLWIVIIGEGKGVV